MKGLLDAYSPLKGTYDELFAEKGRPRTGLERVAAQLAEVTPAEFRQRQRLADAAFLSAGVTFTVYSDQEGVERIFPFDLIPRLVRASDWARIEAGLRQRLAAINLFLEDVYDEQRSLDEIPGLREIVESSEGFLPSLRGVQPPAGVHVHVAGVDLIRGPDGEMCVLEDNARVPSGVSYVLENRAMTKRVFPTMFSRSHVRSVDEYPLRLRRALLDVSPVDPEATQLAVLTPGPFNSAYFEHSFLARRMGCPLVQGSDLFVDGERVYLKSTRGPQQVHVIYRRIDDDFVDPEAFRPESMLGVRGLFRAYAAGNLTLANALGNGVADDKSTYALMPEIIRFFLSEEPLLAQVPTYLCSRDEDLRYVLAHLGELVVKQVDASGGYGMLMGPTASRKEISEFRRRIEASPRSYIAQPRIELSTCPAWTADGVAPRRVDLRPFVITGATTWVLPGGLTRVALKEGSYVVNSSQGGGSKDTWVLGDEEAPA